MSSERIKSISQIHWQPLTKLLQPTGKKQQQLSGFDDEFIDIVDYIIRITHRIWEQKNVGLCYQYYADICPVFTLGGYFECVEQVVQNTLKTIAAFPDRSLIGENVIWKEESDGSYYSSHLITSIMTNTGNSEFGAATNKTGRVTTIADCVCFENKIIKEWLVRDNSFLISQLGIDLIDAAISFAQLVPDPHFNVWFDEEYQRVRETKHRANIALTTENWTTENFVQSWVQTLFNQKQFSNLNDFYHVAASHQWPGGRIATGLAQVSGTLIQWLAQCPDAKMTVDHLAVVGFNEDTIDIAVRWSIAGTYSPQNERLAQLKDERFFVLGASHLRVKNQKIVKEVTVFDEISLYANLIRQSGCNLPLADKEPSNV
ncbi:nuclear transport factor 2 family protein [Thalassotalea fonticola]|uniref:Nuclear transport factor 2 family protein n=1 Tax=Thalassotalea fonticola TaxID=3065649 RepID=A0ABZ0GIM9_9GAMM|nr:nuclear transport factor 2 family protein [Colwelliaceae bacterium S1-1]